MSLCSTLNNICLVRRNKTLIDLSLEILTHLKQIFISYTPWKRQKICRAYRNSVSAQNGSIRHHLANCGHFARVSKIKALDRIWSLFKVCNEDKRNISVSHIVSVTSLLILTNFTFVVLLPNEIYFAWRKHIYHSVNPLYFKWGWDWDFWKIIEGGIKIFL